MNFISKENGGLGIDISSIRHSQIADKGESQGIIPMAKVLESVAKYVDQAGLRKGAYTLSCDAFHIDILELINALGDA